MRPAALREENSQPNLVMKNPTLNRFLAATAVAFIALGSLLPVEAQARSRSTTITGARGTVYNRQVNKTPGKVSAAESVTLPNGQTASRSVNSQKTDTGRTTSAQATGLNGQTATYDSTRTKTDTGYNREATVTGPQGASATKQVDVTKQDGTITRTVTSTTTPKP
jgi:hypothetical protein